MANTLQLLNPVHINGKTYKELTYDSQKITPLDFSMAAAKAQGENITNNQMSQAAIAETNITFHLYLGFVSIIAENPDIDFADLEMELHGTDIWNVMQIGRDFQDASVTASTLEASENTSGSTPENSTPRSKK